MAVRAAALSPVVGGALLLATAFPLEASRGAPATAASGVVCNGKERWDIKTLSDPAAGKVNLDPAKINKVSVQSLRLKKRPPGFPEATRSAPVETTVYEVKAALVEARWIWDPRPGTPTKNKGDRDIHLVIAAPSDHSLTMIVEFPDPARVNAAPAVEKMIHDARNAFLACRGLMPSADKPFQKLTGTATINGVRFFDRPHTTGHAPDGIELHPVPFYNSTDRP
jgi:hypothetical protein